ncbi:hypothetical protein F4824DRAFT_475964 [Ustulina deusta]|nr:hypothetical protein F4824DRAFT_475964 [Ustulina deusta]
MSSTNPTQLTEPAMDLTWDCTGNEKAARTLANQWISETDHTSPYVDKGYPRLPFKLDSRDDYKIRNALRLSEADMKDEVEGLLGIDFWHFETTRNKLLSLLIAWERLIYEKNQFQKKGRYEGNLNYHQLYILFQLAWTADKPGLHKSEFLNGP